MNEIEQRLQYFLELRSREEGTINSMMEMKLVRYDIEQKQIALSFPVAFWELNPANHMHGGLISTAMDITMGCVAYVFSHAQFTPTIQLSLNFNKSIQEHDTLLIEGICDHVGSRMAQTRAIARVIGSEDVVASANGSYAINIKK